MDVTLSHMLRGEGEFVVGAPDALLLQVRHCQDVLHSILLTGLLAIEVLTTQHGFTDVQLGTHSLNHSSSHTTVPSACIN